MIISRSGYTNHNVGTNIFLSLVLVFLPKIIRGLSSSYQSQSDSRYYEDIIQQLRPIDVGFELEDENHCADNRIHTFDYFYKPGMKLRPAPVRARSSSAWKPVRQRLLSPFMEIRDEPRRTELVKRLEDHLWQGDELMDAVIGLGHRIGLGVVRKMVMTALADGIQALQDPPTEIVKLFKQLDTTPDWFDADEFENGRVVFSNASWFGPIGSLIVNKTITSQAESVASAVGATGQYTSGTTKTQIRRHLETTHFFARVPRPGGWNRYLETFQETVKVRFMHCQVRYLLKKRWGPEHFNRHGMPISSSDMAYGIVTFGVLRLVCDGVFGFKHSTEDLDSVVRFWGYIGYIFGVPEEIIPRNFHEATQVLDYGLASYGTPTPYTFDIVKSFDVFSRELRGVGRTPIHRLLNKMNEQLVHGLTYFICGDVLGSRMVFGSKHSKGYLRMVSLVAAVFTKFSLSVVALKDGLPGRTKRMKNRAINGDPFENYIDGLSSDLMSRYGLRPTFDAHDKHSVNDFRQN